LIEDTPVGRRKVMSVPVWVEQQNGKFTATVLGAPQVRAEGSTREEAIRALRATIAGYRDRGQLVLLDVYGFTAAELAARPPLTAEEEEAWREVVAGIYRERDEQKAREFPE
jgi:hypothetical protein